MVNAKCSGHGTKVLGGDDWRAAVVIPRIPTTNAEDTWPDDCISSRLRSTVTPRQKRSLPKERDKGNGESRTFSAVRNFERLTPE